MDKARPEAAVVSRLLSPAVQCTLVANNDLLASITQGILSVSLACHTRRLTCRRQHEACVEQQGIALLPNSKAACAAAVYSHSLRQRLHVAHGQQGDPGRLRSWQLPGYLYSQRHKCTRQNLRNTAQTCSRCLAGDGPFKDIWLRFGMGARRYGQTRFQLSVAATFPIAATKLMTLGAMVKPGSSCQWQPHFRLLLQSS